MKKAQVKLIGIIANNLPNQGQVSNINTLITGNDIFEDILLGGRSEVEGKGIDPDKEYIIPNILVMPVDHIKRIKRAFKSNGKTGIIEYCKRFLKGKDSSKLEEAINMVF